MRRAFAGRSIVHRAGGCATSPRLGPQIAASMRQTVRAIVPSASRAITVRQITPASLTCAWPMRARSLGECVILPQGVCGDPAVCTRQADCLKGNFCVAGACVPEAEACAMAGCPAEQSCVNDSESLTVACGENPDGCRTSRGCFMQRVCTSANQCGEPAACEPDLNEPNDEEGEATDYVLAGGQGLVGSVCGQDVDLIRFDTATTGIEKGSLLVDVRFATERSIGLGELKAELFYKGRGGAERGHPGGGAAARAAGDVGVCWGVRVESISPGGLKQRGASCTWRRWSLSMAM